MATSKNERQDYNMARFISQKQVKLKKVFSFDRIRTSYYSKIDDFLMLNASNMSAGPFRKGFLAAS